jgi:SPRY domain
MKRQLYREEAKGSFFPLYSDNRFIGIGFCRATVTLNRLPGWEPDSWGYHGDDGHSFCCQGIGKSYGPTFTTGDVIGCCINFRKGIAFYTKNGVELDTAFRELTYDTPGKNPKGEFFPSIGLRTPGEQVRVNFGQKPFVFDIGGYVQVCFWLAFLMLARKDASTRPYWLHRQQYWKLAL